jgi:hypothetical protein
MVILIAKVEFFKEAKAAEGLAKIEQAVYLVPSSGILYGKFFPSFLMIM